MYMDIRIIFNLILNLDSRILILTIQVDLVWMLKWNVTINKPIQDRFTLILKIKKSEKN